MKYLFVSVCVLILATVEAHLQGAIRLIPQPPYPGATPLNGGFWAGPNVFRGGLNNIIPQQDGWNNFGQWPQTWGTQNVWNNGVFPAGNERNNFNNNRMASKDPWETYRKFNSGMKSLSGTNQGQVNRVSPNIAPANQLASGVVNNNYPWNTFATQGFNTNAGVTNSFNQGFVRPQMQPNFNTRFTNNQFQNQGFPNTFSSPNVGFL